MNRETKQRVLDGLETVVGDLSFSLGVILCSSSPKGALRFKKYVVGKLEDLYSRYDLYR